MEKSANGKTVRYSAFSIDGRYWLTSGRGKEEASDPATGSNWNKRKALAQACYRSAIISGHAAMMAMIELAKQTGWVKRCTHHLLKSRMCMIGYAVIHYPTGRAMLEACDVEGRRIRR